MQRSLTLPLVLLAIWIFVRSFICHEYVCVEKGQVETPIVKKEITPIPEVIKPTGWSISDGTAFASSSAGYIQFASDSIANLPLSAEVEQNFTAAVNYLRGNANRQVNIIGRYMESETNTSILPNLGLARANGLKAKMVSLGVPAKQLKIDSELVGQTHYANSILDRGADLKFGKIDASDPRLAEINSRLLGKPLTVYFQTGSSAISFNSQQKIDLADMLYYIDNVEGSKMAISGHTDNVGNRQYNVGLSKERAEQVRTDVARRLGLQAQQSSVIGHGPDKPIATNTTEAGKAKNRRVEITLQ